MILKGPRYVKHVFLDIEGFTKNRTVETQAEIIEVLNKVVLNSIESLNIKLENTILIPTGDGICISILETASDYDLHISLAKTILNNLSQHNETSKSDEKKFQIRIGINENVDNVLEDINGRMNIAGNGINFAQRIMDCADGGQIMVSQSVFDVLNSRMDYFQFFKEFKALGKHNLQFRVYQYIDPKTIGMNTNIPSHFQQFQKSDPKLTKYHGYYIALALENHDFLFPIRKMPEFDYVSVILLHFLATDYLEISERGKYSSYSPITWKFGESKFGEQFAYYRENDFMINCELSSYIIEKYLRIHNSLFERPEPYLDSFAFINDKGKSKLKKEMPEVIEELGISF